MEKGLKFTVQCEESGGQVLDKQSDGRVSAVQCEESGGQMPNTADSCTVKHKEPESGSQEVTRICKKGKYEKCGICKYGFYTTFKKLYMYIN